MLSYPGSLARKECCCYRLGRGQSGSVISDDRSHHPGTTGISIALNVRKAGHSLDHRIIGALVGIGTLGAIAGDRYIDYIVANSSHCLFAQTYALSNPGTKVVNQRLRTSYQLLDDLKTSY